MRVGLDPNGCTSSSNDDDTQAIRTWYKLGTNELWLSVWLTDRATTVNCYRISTMTDYGRLWNNYDELSRAFPRFRFYRVPRSSEERVFFRGGVEKSVGNKTNFLFGGPWFFSKSQDLFFYDVLFSTVVSTSIWPTHVLQPWDFLYSHGPLQTYAGICFARRSFR